jgi:hypothetical protein
VISDNTLKYAWIAATVGVVGLACAVSFDKPWVAPHAPHETSDGGANDGGSDAAPASSAAASASAAPAHEPVLDLDASVPQAPSLTLDFALGDASARSVKVGIVLVQFAGAQGAAPNARPKTAALDLAKKLSEEAKTDFHQAVTHGDSGSADDIGRIGRGILEPAVESLVFTMAAGQTSEPVETPRGYWVVKRLE